jgi:hypothetical protein
MAVKLNLLPADYSLTDSVRQLIKIARSLNVILLALFFITVIGMGGFFIFSSISLNGLIKENDNLKSQIQEKSTTQQQIVLLKDRLSQIKTVQELPNAIKNFDKISPILGLVTGNSVFSELGIDSQKITTSIIFKSNSDLTNFLKSVSSSSTYSTVSLGTFNYSPVMGYQVGLSFIAK